jgi:hypothetical protein
MAGLYEHRWEALRHYVRQASEADQEWFIGACERRFDDGYDPRLHSGVAGEVDTWMYDGAGPFSDDDEEPLDDSVEWDVFYVLAVAETFLERTVDDVRDLPGQGFEHERQVAELVEATFTWMWERVAEIAELPPEQVPVLMHVAEGPLLRLSELLAQAKRLMA